jgi:chromosome segregation and condensation protein ScpB
MLSKHTAMAKAKVKSLFYKNKRSLSFEKVMEILSKSFSTLDKDLDKRYLECYQSIQQWQSKAKVKSLFYKNERSLSFEKVMEILSKSFSTLDKDLDKRYLECQKVEKLLQCIQTPDMEVVTQTSVIVSQYANDFSGACNYFSAQVSHLHGGAQLENSKYMKKHNVSAMYGRGG